MMFVLNLSTSEHESGGSEKGYATACLQPIARLIGFSQVETCRVWQVLALTQAPVCTFHDTAAHIASRHVARDQDRFTEFGSLVVMAASLQTKSLKEQMRKF
jgi:hypothetical protein